MKELLLERRRIDAERGQLCCRYSVLVGEKKAGNFLCEAYGVKIEEISQRGEGSELFTGRVK